MPIELLVSVVGFVAGGIGWVIVNLIANPIIEMRSAIRAAYEDTTFCSNQYGNSLDQPAGETEGPGDRLRRDAMRVNSLRLRRIPFHKVYVKLNWIPSDSDLDDFHRSLIFLSNSMGPLPPFVRNQKFFDKIENCAQTIERVAGKKTSAQNAQANITRQ